MKSKAIVVTSVALLTAGAVFFWLRQSPDESAPDENPGVKVEFTEAEILEQDEVSQQPVMEEELIELIQTSDMSDPTVREQLAAQVRTQEEAIRAAAHARAERLGIPIREEWEDGRVVEIQGFDGNVPIYFSTHNDNAAYASKADEIRNHFPYNVSGEGVTVGVWDSGKAYNRHSALGEKNVVIQDQAKDYSNHATHVTGTITADDTGRGEPGMAPSSLVWSYDWNFDISEILLAGAGSESEGNRVSISNHSYGQLVGYENGRYRGQYYWFGDEIDEHSKKYGSIKGDRKAGRYSERARVIDTIGFSMPYLTSFFAAGNDRTHNPKPGNRVAGFLDEGTFEEGSADTDSYRVNSFTFNSKKSPKGDGEWRRGFENIGGAAVAKNNIVVGAVDARDGRLEAKMSTFSSWGPTDDGRIKPDIVAHGVQVNSTNTRGSYEEMSGTSMATPSASGSAALLVELYRDKFKNRLMPSTTLKALLIHTADDLGRPGPDYTFGWGLINVEEAADVILKHEKFVKKSDPKAGAKLIQREIGADKEPFTFVFQSDGTKPIRATLCWSDPPGPLQVATDSRKSVLSHNLDLLITGPNGEVHRPFTMPYVGDWSLKKLTANATRGKNNTDNVEQIFDKKNPTLNGAGIYQVTVSLDGSLKKGFTQQPFSLVVTGGQALPKGEAVIDMDPVLNFGKVSDGRSKTLHLNIRNLGDEDLLITGFDFGGNLDMSGNFDGTIKPGGLEVVPVTYTPGNYLPNDVESFDTLKVLCTAKAGRITVPLAHTVKGKSNYSPQLLRPEPGVALKVNHIDNLVGSEWSYDWKEESYTNRFAFNQDGTVRIIVVDNPNYRAGDVKAGMEWMPVGPNQVKLYNPGSLWSPGKYPNFEEAIMLKFTSATTFETTSLNGKVIVGRRYGEPGEGEDFTKDLAGKLFHYIYHESKGDTIKTYSTNFEPVFALMQSNGTLKPFQKEDVHGLWDNVTWKKHGPNVIRFYNASTRQEMFVHLVASRFAAFNSYVTVGWNGNNVSGMLMKPWKTDKKPDDLTERHDRETFGYFGGMEMHWRMPGQDAGMPGYWRAYAKFTQEQWELMMPTNPSSRKGYGLPVDRLTWKDAKLWITKMNAKNPLPAGRTWSTQPDYKNGAKDEVIASGFRATIVPK